MKDYIDIVIYLGIYIDIDELQRRYEGMQQDLVEARSNVSVRGFIYYMYIYVCVCVCM